jgi:hypothetical protein
MRFTIAMHIHTLTHTHIPSLVRLMSVMSHAYMGTMLWSVRRIIK